MRNCKWMGVFLIVACLTMVASCMQNKIEQDQTKLTEPPPVVIKEDLTEEEPPKSQEHLLSPVQFESHMIISTATDWRQDEGDTLFILVPPLDSDFEGLAEKVKNLVKRLIVLENRPENISIHIFDDVQALDKVANDPQTEDLNVPVHYLAKYMASPEEGVYRNNLIIFPMAPDSNPVVQAMSDIIDFDPYNW